MNKIHKGILILYHFLNEVIWPKNVMHGLKSGIEWADWLDWSCPVSVALHFRTKDFFFYLLILSLLFFYETILRRNALSFGDIDGWGSNNLVGTICKF